MKNVVTVVAVHTHTHTQVALNNEKKRGEDDV